MIVIFWIAVCVIVYTFTGYGLLLYLIVRVRRLVKQPAVPQKTVTFPHVSLLIAAYNEESLVADKIENCLQLDYPEDKLQIVFVTDGSSDKTADLVRKSAYVELLHQPDRQGKMAAIKRAMPYLKGEITVFTDANTILNREAIIELVKHYRYPQVGAVAGEKKIHVAKEADASSAGEGFYWKYESALKRWDYELYSNVGAAGELFSIRTSLYPPVESDTIIDDHMIAMRIAEAGYIIAYEPGAYALEHASANIKEELKRKIRIAAGGIQSILRLKKAANPFHNPVLFFQYMSHRVLRWTLTPFLLILVFVLNALIACRSGLLFYQLLFAGQLLFYSLAVVGYYLEQRQIRIKLLFIPCYFCMMNYAVIAGIFRYLRKKQSAAWEKSERK